MTVAASSSSTANDKQCKYCGQQFRKREHVVRHERSHSGERPFQCTICGDSFARQDTLLRHTRIHANRANGDDEPTRPGPTGSRRKKGGRTSGASTPRSRHQSPVLTPLTSLDGLQSPSQLSLARHEASSNPNSRAPSPMMTRSPDAPPSLPSWHSDPTLSEVSLFAGAPSYLGSSSRFNSGSPKLAYLHNQYQSAPSLLRKRTHTPSSDSEDGSNTSLSEFESASPRLPLSRDASSTRLSEQVETWAPLGPSLFRSVVAPTSDTRSRPPSPLMPRSQSFPQLTRAVPAALMRWDPSQQGPESLSSFESDLLDEDVLQPSSSPSVRPAMLSRMPEAAVERPPERLRSPDEMSLDSFEFRPKPSPLHDSAVAS